MVRRHSIPQNLLREIIVRVGFPTTLVHAALVCKRWFGHVSDRKFLSHFCKLHSPRLLGCYITEGSLSSKEKGVSQFVPILPQPPEATALIRRLERYNFNAHYIKHCQNGSVLAKRNGAWLYGVHRPLCAEKDMEIIQILPRVRDCNIRKNGVILSKDEGGWSYLYLLRDYNDEAQKSTVRVYMLQDGVWRMHTSATCLHGLHIYQKALLVDNKIYMPAASGDDIVVLDLTASSFSTIRLPPGVKYDFYETMLSQADDASSVYLIHVEELQLHVWLHKGGKWLLVDTICLHQMLAILGMSDLKLENEANSFGQILAFLGISDVMPGDEANTIVRIIQVGDNGRFAFLRIAKCIFYLDIKCRTPCNVYEDT